MCCPSTDLCRWECDVLPVVFLAPGAKGWQKTSRACSEATIGRERGAEGGTGTAALALASCTCHPVGWCADRQCFTSPAERQTNSAADTARLCLRAAATKGGGGRKRAARTQSQSRLTHVCGGGSAVGWLCALRSAISLLPFSSIQVDATQRLARLSPPPAFDEKDGCRRTIASGWSSGH